MPVFGYVAEEPNGKRVRGTIAGESPLAARKKLKEVGLSILNFEMLVVDQRASPGGSLSSRIFRGRKQRETANFVGELATLLTVGVPLVEALDTLIKQNRGQFQHSLLILREAVVTGSSLADSMRRQPDLFDELSVQLVAVGENTGKLDQSLLCLSRFKRRSLEFRDRVFNSLLYPTFLLAISFFVSIFLMTVVVPTLLTNLEELGRPLPLPTRILKAASDYLISNGWWLGPGVLATVAAGAIWSRTTNGRRTVDLAIHRLPIIGPMSLKQEVSRMALVVSTLMSSGIEMLRAIEIAARTSGNSLMIDAMRSMESRIREGQELQTALSQILYFPPMVSQIFSLGQKSGRLEEMLVRLSDDYDQQVSNLANRLAVVIEPVLIIVLSIIVGFILLATLLPILEAGNVM